jgi:prolyl-tRNA editing enzyme YbaK/EbsC (Cys-tRNA(Pro) deacylase)/ubiquinone/menaquinone biosynthesis C-methylase UbiE
MGNWEKHKNEHLKLSAAAADKYDEIYEELNFATGSYMKYELEVLNKYSNVLKINSTALDLGCGTGRDSFFLSKHFEQVYGYDFSPEMILNANKNKIRRNIGNVSFEVLDIEERELPWDKSTIPFINTAFGMGSFIEHIEQLFREIRRVLTPGGICVLSFYNSDALVNQLNLEWKPALAARVVENEDCLEVEFENNKFRIAAKAYSPTEIKKKITQSFGEQNLLQITTFPTLSALFPQSLFNNEKARELCTNVDKLLSTNLDIAAGPYIIAVCKKGGKTKTKNKLKGYANVLSLLSRHNINTSTKIKEHKPVKTMADVREVLDVDVSSMIKSVLVTTVNDTNESDLSHLYQNLFLIGVPANRKVDFGRVSTILNVSRNDLKMANQIQVEEITGFQVGSIPPFGLPKNVPVLLDTSFLELNEIWCGTGKSTESLRLTLEELKALSNPTFNEVSKPTE